jgi:hypothetical protein
MRMFENKTHWRIFGPKRDKERERGEWRKLQNK